jgi:hypothetical protein
MSFKNVLFKLSIITIIILLTYVSPILINLDQKAHLGMRQSEHISLFKISRKHNKKKKNIYLVGNSVYASKISNIELQNQKDKCAECENFNIYSIAQAGSSILDNLFSLIHFDSVKPDLIIVQLAPITFGQVKNLFRTFNDNLVLKEKYRDLLSEKVIRDYYLEKKDIGKVILYSFIPMFREIDNFRFDFFQRLKEIFGENSIIHNYASFFDSFPVPTQDSKNRYMHEFKEDSIYLKIFLKYLQKNKLKVVFIIQEAKFAPNIPMQKYIDLIKENSDYSVYDFQANYNTTNFKDIIHPKDHHIPEYMSRTLKIIKESL